MIAAFLVVTGLACWAAWTAGHCLHHYGPTGIACTLCGEPRPATRTSTTEET